MFVCRCIARSLAPVLCAGALVVLTAVPAPATEAPPTVVIHRESDVAAGDAVAVLVADALGLGARRAPQRTILYEVDAKGDVVSDRVVFRRVVAETLRDPRGWSAGGRVLYVPVHRGGDVRIVLASPTVIDNAHATCSARYSCRVADDVYINDRRWQDGARTYAERPLAEYRRYVINHEFGHWLGLDHGDCRSPGAAALVMQQQTITLDGCESRVWPQAPEKDRAWRNLAAQASPPPPARSPVPPADGAPTRSSRPGSGTR